MNVERFFEGIEGQAFFDDQIVHSRVLEARPPVFETVTGGVHEPIQRALAEGGIEDLYAHQARAVNEAREGRHLVIVTGTASGKTLCYTIPILERLVDEPSSTSLLIYPTKALAQDQLRAFTALREAGDFGFLAGTYDGDTPASHRRKLRDGGHVLLTNPDMLHQGILPQHTRWARFFSSLRFVVIDEVHAYRGVFGSHLANVLRRLSRICTHYGASPQFICSSATIANPGQHAERVCGVPMTLIENDGAPRGRKRFVLWNPPPLQSAASSGQSDWRIGGDRRSPMGEAVHLMAALVKEGVQTIAFVRTRLAAELILRDSRERLRPVSRRLANAIEAYRGGYLPEERRDIEGRLARGDILGVASTNALELGIDIGSLDACIVVGYPGTIASLWQQAGRAGRGTEESLVLMLAQNSPMDQYLMAHPDYIFSKSPENAVVDPDNPHIVVGHLRCATNELALADQDAAAFGPYANAVLEVLEEDGSVRRIDDRWYWSSTEYPAAAVNLRNIAGPVYTIQDQARGGEVIGTMDEISALSQLHDHAVYLHGADTYLVVRLDLDQKVAHVEQAALDYYTQSVQTSEIGLDEVEVEESWRDCLLGFGDATVTTTIPMFKKIRFHSRDSLGYEDLDLPTQMLETVTCWFAPPPDASRALKAEGMLVSEAMIGIANVLAEVVPLYVMCDTQDIGVVLDSRNLGRDAIFLHDRFPGGMGYARRCLMHFEEIMRTVADVIRDCGCPDGCPSCVGSAVTPADTGDLDASVRGRIANKRAAGALLARLLPG